MRAKALVQSKPCSWITRLMTALTPENILFKELLPNPFLINRALSIVASLDE